MTSKKLDLERREYITLLSGGTVVTLAGCSNILGDGEEGDGNTDADPGSLVNEMSMVYNTGHAGAWMEPFQIQVAEYLRDIGLRMQPERMEYLAQASEIVDEDGLDQDHVSTFVLNIAPYRASDPFEMLNRYHSENINNFGKISDDRLNELVETMRTQLDADARAETYKQIQQRASEVVPELTPVFSNYIDAHNSSDWQGWVEVPGGGASSEAWAWSYFQVEPADEEMRPIVIGTTKEHDSTNALTSGSVMEGRAKFLYDPLYRLTPDHEVIPWAATNIEYVNDGSAVDVTLREGMAFHDGEPVTAEDVAFTVNTMASSDANQWLPFFGPTADADDAEALDELTARLHLSSPTPGYTTFRPIKSIILPKHRWEGETVGEYDPEMPIGSGPFQWESWERGTNLTWSAFDDHWSEYPKVDELIFTVIPSVDGLMGALQNGEIAGINTPLSPSQAEQLTGESGITIASTPRIIPVWMYWNLNTLELLHDFELRKAMMYAVNREELAQGVLSGEAQTDEWNSRVHPSMERWFNPDVQTYEYDPERARQILERAGYTWNDDNQLQYPSQDDWEDYQERLENPMQSMENLGQT